MSEDLVERARRIAAKPTIAAHEILTEGRLEVVERAPRRVVVEIAPNSPAGVRRRVTSEAGRLACDCPSFRNGHRCAHVLAAALVVAPAGMRRLRPGDATQPISAPPLEGIEP